MNKGSVERF